MAATMFAVFVIGVFCVAAVRGSVDPHHLCDELLTVDCATQYSTTDSELVCGSNDKTFNNFCEYSQARCRDRSVTVVKVGDCAATTAMPTTTSMQTVPVTTAAMTTQTTTLSTLLQVFCKSKDTIVCGTSLEPICGSDKNFYLNKCEFSKELCVQPGLTEQPNVVCTGAGR